MSTSRRFTEPLPPFPNLTFESPLWQSGLGCVAGLDEAGRGAWAGPVAAAAVILPPDPAVAQSLSGVRDSKLMSPHQRDHWAALIRAQAAAWGVGFATCQEIDSLGILPATRLAMRRALQQLALPPAHLLIDALTLPGLNLPQTALVKGDRRALSIAAASVLAKTARDALMVELENQYPGYHFARHKGYGTRAHHQALNTLGACPQHRRSFAPVAACLALHMEQV